MVDSICSFCGEIPEPGTSKMFVRRDGQSTTSAAASADNYRLGR